MFSDRYHSVKEVRVIHQKQNLKKSKCFGFIYFKDAQQALKAIREMDGVTIGNKKIKLNMGFEKDSKQNPIYRTFDIDYDELKEQEKKQITKGKSFVVKN